MFTNFRLKRLERKTHVVKNADGSTTTLYIKKRNAGVVGFVYDIRLRIVDKYDELVSDRPLERCIRATPEHLKERFEQYVETFATDTNCTVQK